ncbi:cell wall-associated hydrolase (invasion-associated protein) [hydrocarbon metagenome]|uniref:Cell wall-associated hydrolase (Invasion-associated protein) n=1 Tax=hydrocarbon metagenome TaxID=938273 RepID=A0A0W8E7Q6_9ZZZZ
MEIFKGRRGQRSQSKMDKQGEKAEERRQKKLKRREQMDKIHSLIKINRDNRKEIQQITREMNPSLGKAARTYHNLLDTIDNYIESRDNGLNRMLFADNAADIRKGDHLFVQRPGFTHHGIYMGDNLVLHYHMSKVKVTGFEEFAEGAKIQKRSDEESPAAYPAEEIIKRGLSRYGENEYNIIFNNCEHFVRWARNG